MFSVGDKVKGVYFHKRVTGTVTVERLNYRTGGTLLMVALDSPVTVFGETRNSVVFDSVDSNGRDGVNSVEKI